MAMTQKQLDQFIQRQNQINATQEALYKEFTEAFGSLTEATTEELNHIGQQLPLSPMRSRIAREAIRREMRKIEQERREAMGGE